jgi:hypothetical protein
VCGSDPVPNSHPESRAMELAGRPRRKIAKMTECENVNERSPKNRTHWLTVVCGLDQAKPLTH